MTFVALVRDSSVNLISDDMVLAAKDVHALESAVDAGNRLTQLMEQFEQDVAAAKQEGFDEGHAAGRAAGLLAARDEVAAELTALALEAHRQRMDLQSSVARLTTQVVRKLAGEIGTAEMVAGLAQTAASDLLPGAALTLWLHSSAVETVRMRLAAAQAAHPSKLSYIDIRADETLAPSDCILDTACGTVIAGLDAQLERLEIAMATELESVSMMADKLTQSVAAEPLQQVSG